MIEMSNLNMRVMVVMLLVVDRDVALGHGGDVVGGGHDRDV